MNRDATDLLPAWAVEYPHRGDPVAYRIESLERLEALAQEAVGNGKHLHQTTTFAEALGIFGDLDDMREAGGAWARLADERAGVVVQSPGEDEWLAAMPQRSWRDRYEEAVDALRNDLSHLKLVPESRLDAALADPAEWEGRWGQCGGPAGQRALAAETDGWPRTRAPSPAP